MTDISPLRSLYLQQRAYASDRQSDIELAADGFLTGSQIVMDDLIHSRAFFHVPITQEDTVANWKNLLVLALMAEQADFPFVAQKIHTLLQQPWNQESQYLRALIALCQIQAKITPLDVTPTLLISGAALIPLTEYAPWQDLPYAPHHAEFAVFLSLIAFDAKDKQLQQKALQIAHWQLNTLALDFSPVAGLYMQEREGAIALQLLWNYLLFLTASRLCGENTFETAAQAQLNHLLTLPQPLLGSIHPLFPLIEKLINKYSNATAFAEILQLSEKIFDPHMALVGRRFANHHAICTLHGGNTGMGSYRSEDIQIINYGPQYLPLGECRGFGIEGNEHTDHHARKTQIDQNDNGFSLKGCVRMVDEPSSDGMGGFRGIWLETAQEYHERSLHINTQMLGFSNWDGVAFSFFIKAKKCHIENGVSLNARSLNRFDGTVSSVTLQGDKHQLVLKARHSGGSMQIIPLAGGNNFWGADFLVAYLLEPGQSAYGWEIVPGP